LTRIEKREKSARRRRRKMGSAWLDDREKKES
jgi:hypothetical protein